MGNEKERKNRSDGWGRLKNKSWKKWKWSDENNEESKRKGERGVDLGKEKFNMGWNEKKENRK